MTTLTCFKAYDIRGKLGVELNETIAYQIGCAFGEWLGTGKKVVVGSDVRLTSEALKLALAKGLMDVGVSVIDLGMTGTEEIYFATWHLGVDGGIEVTASHNPMDYNGMKLVREGARPVSGDTGLREIQQLVEELHSGQKTPHIAGIRGVLTRRCCLNSYISHLLTYVQLANITPLKLVVNAGNGAAGHVVDALETEFARLHIPITFIKVHNTPDGTFPNGIPNPLLPECRADTARAVLEYAADMGVAWDGDFDRCFLFDAQGQFVEGYYIVGLLADAFLRKQPGSKIIHDPRLTWNTIDIVKGNGGVPVMSKTGHAFIKERMRIEDAVYGGEMSAHHYFRDFAYCDSGMIPWLLVAELISSTGRSLSELVGARVAAYPCSGEINFRVEDVQVCLQRVREYFLNLSPIIDFTDGLSMEFTDWRFNLRGSNTEPVLRLNVESRGDDALMRTQTEVISQLLT